MQVKLGDVVAGRAVRPRKEEEQRLVERFAAGRIAQGAQPGGSRRGQRLARQPTRRLERGRAGYADDGDGRRRSSARQREEGRRGHRRSEEHTSELQSLMRISYAVFFLKKKKNK